VKAQEMENTGATSTPELAPVPILIEESATSTDVLASPISESVTTEQKNTKTIQDEEFLKQCSLSKCRIPIPTLKDPNNKNFDLGQKIYLTGLTWNNTIIDVYVDGLYVGNAVVRNDEKSDTANFYLEFENNLNTGSHKWSVIAWSLNRGSRSFVSDENIFTVLKGEATQTQIHEQKTEATSTTSTSSISEEKEVMEVISEETDIPVSVDTSDIQIGVEVTSSEEKDMIVDITETKLEENVSSTVEQKEMLVVENYLKSEDKYEEGKALDSETAEIVQNATPSEELKQEIQEDIEIDNSQETKKKTDLTILAALVVFVGLFVIFFRKK
jgi:hypothetical protein